MKSIDDYAFYYTALKEIILPDSIETIGKSAFSGSTDLKDIYYNGTAEQWNAIEIASDNGPLINAKKHYAPDATGTPTPTVTQPPTGTPTPTPRDNAAISYNLFNHITAVENYNPDGSYVISLEDNPFFPYEVHFYIDDNPTIRWFMNGDDSIQIGGHDFSVTFNGTARSVGIRAGDIYIPSYSTSVLFCLVYPDSHTFSE